MNMMKSGSGASVNYGINPVLQPTEAAGSWTDWALLLAKSGKVGDSGQVIILAERLAKQAAISTEAATAMLLWLGSVCMIHHTRVQWPSGIWEPAGLTISVVEDDGVPIDSITNAFISLAQNLGLDPIHETVKEGPAGLISRLETAGTTRKSKTEAISIESLTELANLNTESMQEQVNRNKGNARALIYPSGRAFLSYLYDTPFFNTIDELIQHGNLSVRGKASNHKLRELHLSTIVNFYQGSLVTLTHDSRVQNNMTALLRQMLIFWPTSGTKRHTTRSRIDIALHSVEGIAREGLKTLETLSDGVIQMPDLPDATAKPLIAEGVGIRYTVLNRQQRISRLALAVAFWRIAAGGKFEITNGDLAVADSVLHLHEMGGRLFELVMSKGKLGHEFMRIFLSLLNGEENFEDSVRTGEEISHASELNIGATAMQRLGDMSITTALGALADEYRFVTGHTSALHKKRWHLT